MLSGGKNTKSAGDEKLAAVLGDTAQMRRRLYQTAVCVRFFYTGCGLFIVFRGKSGYHTDMKRDEVRFG